MGQGRPETALRRLPIHSGTASLKPIRIRRARPQDLSAILRIEADCFAQDAWPGEFFRHYQEHPATLFLIAATATRTVGYTLAASAETGPRQSAWSLDSLAVSPKAQSQGIATRLLRRIINALSKQGAARLSLMVRRDNAAAIHLYRKLGFRRMNRVNDYYEDGLPAWRMMLELVD